MRKNASCSTFFRMQHDKSIICHNCSQLQEKNAILEKNNQILRAQVAQKDAFIIELHADFIKAHKENIILKQNKQQLRTQIEQKDAAVVALYFSIAEQGKKIKSLCEANYNLAKQLFGPKSESSKKLKKSKNPTLDTNENKNQEINNSHDSDKTQKKCKKPNRSNSRKPPINLPKLIVYHTLPPGQDICSCCSKHLGIINYKTSYQYDIIPAKLQVIEHQRAQYACSSCKNGNSMKLASFPKSHNYNVLATPNLLAWIAVNKYDYHLPIWRQIRMIQAISGHKLTYNTLNSWVINTAFDLQPIVARLIDIMIRQKLLFSDDTTTKTIVPGVNKTKTSRLWVYISKETPIVIYDFTMSRDGEHPKSFLKNFSGYLQTDAYKAYYALYKDENGKIIVIPVFCMAHCRRYFFKIAELSDRFGLADEALEYIKKLYMIEDEIKDKSVDERYQRRQKGSIPILNEFHAWLIKTKATVLPEYSLDKAINYALNNWTELTNYCLDGRLEIDNNRSERKMRGPKLGMNNYQFYGSEKGGLAAAIYLSLFETCKENNIVPYIWLVDILPKLRYYKSSQLDELLPLQMYWYQYRNDPLKQVAA